MGFNIIFVDEFKISNYTHSNYNWVQKGDYCGVPIAGFQEYFCCIAAVSKCSLITLQTTKSNTNSTVFSLFVEQLIAKLRQEHPQNLAKTVLFMDGARYHTSRESVACMRKLGLSVLFNAPAFPEINSCEYFIRALKAKIKVRRDHTE